MPRRAQRLKWVAAERGGYPLKSLSAPPKVVAMATHAFVAYRLTIAPTGHPKDLLNLADIDGRDIDLLHLTHGFLRDINVSIRKSCDRACRKPA